MQSFVVVLGWLNNRKGVLGPFGLTRYRTAAEILAQNPQMKVITTGGFGKTFNRTDKPHGEWVKKAMIEAGVAPERFAGIAISTNTHEDAIETRKLLEQMDIRKAELTIVTSGDHLPRAQYLFERVFSGTEHVLRYTPAWPDSFKVFCYSAWAIVRETVYLWRLKAKNIARL